MKRYMILFSVLFLLGSAAGFADNPKAALTLPLGGTFNHPTLGAGTFEGSFKVVQFAVENGELVARGYVAGTLTTASGEVIGSVIRTASLPVEASSAASARGRASTQKVGALAICPILHLELGPLDLDLLGLLVHLDRVVLDISAESGAGNLLGNLLCAVVGLLDGPGALTDIADLLNRILDFLSGLLG